MGGRLKTNALQTLPANFAYAAYTLIQTQTKLQVAVRCASCEKRKYPNWKIINISTRIQGVK
jgi:hypothetical protein